MQMYLRLIICDKFVFRKMFAVTIFEVQKLMLTKWAFSF